MVCLTTLLLYILSITNVFIVPWIKAASINRYNNDQYINFPSARTDHCDALRKQFGEGYIQLNEYFDRIRTCVEVRDNIRQLPQQQQQHTAPRQKPLIVKRQVDLHQQQQQQQIFLRQLQQQQQKLLFQQSYPFFQRQLTKQKVVQPLLHFVQPLPQVAQPLQQVPQQTLVVDYYNYYNKQLPYYTPAFNNDPNSSLNKSTFTSTPAATTFSAPAVRTSENRNKLLGNTNKLYSRSQPLLSSQFYWDNYWRTLYSQKLNTRSSLANSAKVNNNLGQGLKHNILQIPLNYKKDQIYFRTKYIPRLDQNVYKMPVRSSIPLPGATSSSKYKDLDTKRKQKIRSMLNEYESDTSMFEDYITDEQKEEGVNLQPELTLNDYEYFISPTQMFDRKTNNANEDESIDEGEGTEERDNNEDNDVIDAATELKKAAIRYNKKYGDDSKNVIKYRDLLKLRKRQDLLQKLELDKQIEQYSRPPANPVDYLSEVFKALDGGNQSSATGNSTGSDLISLDKDSETLAEAFTELESVSSKPKQRKKRTPIINVDTIPFRYYLYSAPTRTLIPRMSYISTQMAPKENYVSSGASSPNFIPGPIRPKMSLISRPMLPKMTYITRPQISPKINDISKPTQPKINYIANPLLLKTIFTSAPIRPKPSLKLASIRPKMTYIFKPTPPPPLQLYPVGDYADLSAESPRYIQNERRASLAKPHKTKSYISKIRLKKLDKLKSPNAGKPVRKMTYKGIRRLFETFGNVIDIVGKHKAYSGDNLFKDTLLKDVINQAMKKNAAGRTPSSTTISNEKKSRIHHLFEEPAGRYFNINSLTNGLHNGNSIHS